MSERRFRCCCNKYLTCEACSDGERTIRADERKKFAKPIIVELEKAEAHWAEDMQPNDDYEQGYVSGLLSAIKLLKERI